jgi:outer membrane protein insertion porin family
MIVNPVPAGCHVRRILVLAALAVSVSARPAAAQIPYNVFDENTQVSSLRFRFTAGRSFKTDLLKQQIATAERGLLAGLREAFDFLPLISAPPPKPFSPLMLQRDVARLRRFYHESGFVGTEVRYEVTLDRGDNEVDITLLIDEGEPIEIRSLAIRTPSGGDPGDALPENLKPVWNGFVDRTAKTVGRRYTEAERTRVLRDILNWWTNRGWAFADAKPEETIDSTAAKVDLVIALDPGPRARVGEIDIEGNESVSDDVILRTLPFERGDWFSSSKLAEGQRRIFGLDLFRLALADLPKEQPHDSAAAVRIRLQESPLRLVTGELGYVSAGGGITTRGQFAHRNFLGGARTLRISADLQTGAFSFGDRPEREYRLSVAYRWPYFFDPRLSLNVSPFAQYRDNQTDRSWQGGIETSLIYELSASRFVTLQHRYSARKVLDYRIGSGSSVDLATLLQLVGQGGLDELGSYIQRSTLSLSATIGRFDPTAPTDALQVQPTIEVTTPSALNTIEYSHFELPVTGYLPLTDRIAIAGRVRLGRVFPFGKTVRGDSIGALERVQLRDVLLSAGGTGSARGWANGLLGPKLLNLEFENVEGTDSIVVTGTDGYIPAGGLARASGSVEMRLPFPGLGETWGTHVFLDAGRVWSPDSRFTPDTEDPNNENRWFFGTGAGIDVRTLVGPIRVSVGYKLNPSPLDLRDPDKLFEAIANGLPVTSVPEDWKRRLHLHISLGQTF